MSYKITDLSTGTSVASGDHVPFVDVDDTTQAATGTTKKITYANFVAGILAELGITSSVAELNVLDGVAAGLTAAELSILDGVTSNAAEINLLDGKTLAGADATILTGTAGTSGNLAQWNADGDLVDSSTPPSGTIVGTSDTQTLTNKRRTLRTTATTQSATPTINTDNTDVAYITGLAQAITSMTTNLSGTPIANDLLWVSITDNGTARAIAWGASFESSGNVALPTTTVISTRLDVLLAYNTATSKWRCVAVA